MKIILLINLSSFAVLASCMLPPDQKGCYFNGVYYSSISFITYNCFRFRCYCGLWEFWGILSYCRECRVYGDPYIKTFDGTNYKWHGICNYTLSQYFYCDGLYSYCPKYAIYSDFERCGLGILNWGGSELHTSTYKVNPNTAITIKHDTLSMLKINGNIFNLHLSPYNPFPYPVFIWKLWNNNCAYIAGPDYSIIACKTNTPFPSYTMSIYTTPFHLYKIDGLCGQYTNKPTDDFRSRIPCTVTSLPPFAISWLTLHQLDDCCPAFEPFKSIFLGQSNYERECSVSAESGFQYCNEPVIEDEIVSAVEMCIENTGNDPENYESWLNVTADLAYLVCENQNLLTEEKEEENVIYPDTN